jgi:DNA replication protein DnaC
VFRERNWVRVDAWHNVIDEPTLADAILDRRVHNAYGLELDGPSLQKMKGAEKPKNADGGATN